MGTKPNLISIWGTQDTWVLLQALLLRLLTLDKESFSLLCLSFPTHKTATTSHRQHLMTVKPFHRHGEAPKGQSFALPERTSATDTLLRAEERAPLFTRGEKATHELTAVLEQNRRQKAGLLRAQPSVSAPALTHGVCRGLCGARTPFSPLSATSNITGDARHKSRQNIRPGRG